MFRRKSFSIALMLLVVLMLASTAHAGERVKLVLWTFVEDHQKFYEKMAEKFNKEYPQYELDLEATTMPTDQMHDKLLMSLLAGVGAPDIVDVNIQYAGMFFKGNPQYFVNLTDLAEKYKKVMSPIRLYLYIDRKGNVLGLPTHVGTAVMYYNKPEFDKAGISIDDIRTYDQWIKIGQKMTRREKNVWMTSVQSMIAREFQLFLAQKGGNVFDKNGDLVVDSEKGIEALQFIHDLVYKYKIATIAPGGLFHDPSFYTLMDKGGVLSLPYAQWYMIRFKNFMPSLKGKMVVRPLPVWEPGGYKSACMGGTGTAITAQCKHVDVAKKFLEFAKLSYEGNAAIWTDLGFDPPRMDVYDDPRLLQPDPYFGNEKPMRVIRSVMDRLAPHYVEPLTTEVELTLNRETIFNVLENKKTPAQALHDVANAFRKKIKK